MKAFKTWSQSPEDIRPEGIGLDWPWIVQECVQEDVANLEIQGYTILSDGNYTAYLAERQEDMDLWNVSFRRSKMSPISQKQIRQALIISEINLNDVGTALNSLSEPTKSLALISWEYSNQFERLDPLISQVATALGWTDTDLDNLWSLAVTL